MIFHGRDKIFLIIVLEGWKLCMKPELKRFLAVTSASESDSRVLWMEFGTKQIACLQVEQGMFHFQLFFKQNLHKIY